MTLCERNGASGAAGTSHMLVLPRDPILQALLSSILDRQSTEVKEFHEAIPIWRLQSVLALRRLHQHHWGFGTLACLGNYALR